MKPAITPHAVNNQINNLRRKLGPGREWIETIYGLGFKFKG